MVVKPSDLGLDSADLKLIVQRYFGNSITSRRVEDAWIESFGGSPDGFLAEHFLLKIRLNPVRVTPEELSLFMKVVPTTNPSLAKYLNEMGSFRKEVTLCENIIPKLQGQYQSKQLVPQYLLTKDERLVVMENVKLKGFDILKGTSGLLDRAHLEKALETMAYFHAGSIVLEEKNAKSLSQMFPKALEENAWTGVAGSIRTRDVENVIVLWCEFFRIVERSSSRLAEIIAALPTTIRSLYELVKPSTVWRNVFCHGDLWNNNVMFKHTSDGGPSECILVDFQLSRYTPPAYDINLLLSLTTTLEFRSKHMKSLLDSYYEHFQQALLLHGIDPSQVYRKESFLQSCQYYRLAGQIHGSIIGPEVLLAQSYLDEIFVDTQNCAGFMPQSKVSICVRAFQTDKAYRERLLDMIQELLPSSV